MDNVKNVLNYLYVNCNVDNELLENVNDVLDRLDIVLNIIDGVKEEDLYGCQWALKRIKKIVEEG